MTSEARTPIKVDPATGLKTFDTRAAKANDKIVGKGYSVTRDDCPQGAAGAAAGRPLRRRGAGEVPGVQGDPSRRRRLHGDGRRVRQVPRGRLLRAAGRARGAHRRVRHPRRRRRVRRAAALVQAEPGRLRRRPLLREGRRRRGHVVLEPLPGHRLRRRVVQLLPAAGGDGLRPVDEVRRPASRSTSTARRWRRGSGSTTTACSTPPSRRRSGTRTAGAGPSTPTAATPCGRAS